MASRLHGVPPTRKAGMSLNSLSKNAKNNGEKVWTPDLRQDINRVSSNLAGALMEHFLEGIALLRHCYINPNEKRNKYKFSLLI